jgi:hypothetical protein
MSLIDICERKQARRVSTLGRLLPPPATCESGPAPRRPVTGVQRVLTHNGPAILAELAGEWWPEADAAALATITQPTLLVAAAESPREFREPISVYAAVLSDARTALVGGDHIIDPAAPVVIAFVEHVLEGSGARDERLSRCRETPDARA